MAALPNTRIFEINRKTMNRLRIFNFYPNYCYLASLCKAHLCTWKIIVVLLANVNSRSRSLYIIARPSVCNVRAPDSGD